MGSVGKVRKCLSSKNPRKPHKQTTQLKFSQTELARLLRWWFMVSLHKNVLIKIFFVPRPRSVVTIKSRNFCYCESLVLYGFILIYQGLLSDSTSIHASFILRRIVDKIPAAQGLVRPENNRVQDSSDILKWGLGALHTGNIRLISPNHLSARIGYPQVPIAGNHRLSLLVHLSTLHPHSLGSIHLKASFLLSREHAPFRCESCWRPSVLLHPSGCHYCLNRCQLQMFLKPQVCVEYRNGTHEHQSGHQSSYWLWTSVLNFSDQTRTGVTHSPPHPTKFSTSPHNSPL